MAKKVAAQPSLAALHRSQKQQLNGHLKLWLAAALLTIIGVVLSRGWVEEDELVATTASASASGMGNRHASRSGGAKMNMEGPRTIQYVGVESGYEDVKRYAAVYLDDSKKSVSIKSWMKLVSSSTPEGARAAADLSDAIAACPWGSVLFETPGTTLRESGDTPFEFALVYEPALQRFAEPSPDLYSFKEHFDACIKRDGAATSCLFANLRGDAMLVAPLQQKHVEAKSYSHLGAFVRDAPKEQTIEFWRLAATTQLEVLRQRHKVDKNAPTWFSTNGMGVSWLHLRVDGWPKYYSYGPFKGQTKR